MREVIILDMRAVLARVTAELAEEEAKLRAQQEHVDELRTMRAGLELAVGKYEPARPGEEGAAADEQEVTPDATRDTDRTSRRNLPGIPPPSSRRKGKQQPSQTDLSFAALTEFGRPASTAEVRERVAAAGYDKLKTEQIRSALTWLMTKKRVVRVAPGTWAIPQVAAAQDDFTPAAGTTGVNGASANGPTIQGVAVPTGAA